VAQAPHNATSDPEFDETMAKLALVLTALIVAACSPTSTSAGPIVSSSTASTLRGPSSSPATGSPADSTPSGIAAAKQVAIDGAIKQTGATYLAGDVDVLVACPSTATKCLAIHDEVDGVHAAYFRGHLGSSSASALCLIYTVQDAAGWRFLDMACAGPESGVAWPDVGEIDLVFVPAGSCANVRANPGLSGKVVACLRADTSITIDGGPDYVVEPPPNVSHLWWHIKGMGWMAHDFLVQPYFLK
jgi:hypothetical protein